MNKPTMALMVLCATVTVALAWAPPVRAEDSGAAATTQAQSQTPVIEPDYKIQEEDILRLDVWGEPQLSNMQMQVTSDGKVNVPYVGDTVIAGLTQADASKLIAKRLEDDGILVLPKVVLTLLSLHRPTVRVLGAVQKSGSFEFKDGDRVLDAVAQAGYLDNSWLEEATLTHRGPNQKPIKINLQKMLSERDYSQNFELAKGDVINIPPEEYANKFYVMGQVNRPMMYDLKDKTTVLAAINLAGGQTERAKLRDTVVIRKNPKDPAKPEKVPCNLAKVFDKGDLTQDVELQPGDVVFVPETNKPNWVKLSQVLSTITSLTYIRRYGLF